MEKGLRTWRAQDMEKGLRTWRAQDMELWGHKLAMEYCYVKLFFASHFYV